MFGIPEIVLAARHINCKALKTKTYFSLRVTLELLMGKKEIFKNIAKER